MENNKFIFSEAIDVNPKRNLKRGEIAKFIDMKSVEPFTRKVLDITEKNFNGSGSKFEKGDTIFARITPCLENGKTAYIDNLKDNETAFGSTEFIVFSGKENITDNKFVYYLSRSPQIRDYAIKNMVGTSGRQRVDKSCFDKLEISIPSVENQKKIVSILSALDDKIELNNEMNKTLEEMAQAIFKSWFVDFEPFKDGEFEESELGMIPKGWKVVKLGEIGDVKGGKRLPKGSKLEDIKTEHPYLRVTDVTNGYVDLAQIKYIADEVSDSVSRYIINKEDIYISIAGTIGVCGIIPKSISGANLTENMARIIPNDNNYRNYILLYLKSKNGKSAVKSRTVGSTQPKLPLYGIKEIPILYNADVIKKFSKAVDGILERIQHNLEQNNELKNIRDTLLPKLITGEIKI